MPHPTPAQNMSEHTSQGSNFLVLSGSPCSASLGHPSLSLDSLGSSRGKLLLCVCGIKDFPNPSILSPNSLHPPTTWVEGFHPVHSPVHFFDPAIHLCHTRAFKCLMFGGTSKLIRHHIHVMPMPKGHCSPITLHWSMTNSQSTVFLLCIKVSVKYFFCFQIRFCKSVSIS